MRITVHTADGLDPMDCPHQFVGRCEQCSAPARTEEPAGMAADKVADPHWLGTGALAG